MKFRIFISSVQREFARERRQLAEYIRKVASLPPPVFTEGPDFRAVLYRSDANIATKEATAESGQKHVKGSYEGSCEILKSAYIGQGNCREEIHFMAGGDEAHLASQKGRATSPYRPSEGWLLGSHRRGGRDGTAE